MILAVSLLVFALCFVLVPPVIGFAWRIGAVDVPSDWRRMHPRSKPRAGGIAVFLSFAVGCLAMGALSRPLLCTLGGGFLLLTVGLADDIFCLGAWTKLFFQASATLAAVLGCGVLDGGRVFLAVLWVLLLTNAHNFIDGLDGLLSGSATIEGGMLSLAFFLGGMEQYAAYPLLLGVAALAFRYYNRYPARIFAGDCGSGTIGFLFGMLSLPLLDTHAVTLGSLAPLFLFAYPLTDLFTAVIRRVMRGKSPFLADRAHLHHRISDAGLTQPQTVGALLSIYFFLSLIGVMLSAGLFLAGSIACIVTVAVMVYMRRFILSFA